MTVRKRIALCRLIEKIEKHEVYAKNIGIINLSKFKEKKTSIHGVKDMRK